MKRISVLLFFLTLGKVCLAERTPGTIIFGKNDQEEVVFDLPVALNAINYFKLQEKVKYTDSFGIKKTLRPEQAKEIVFNFNGEEIKMISIPKSGDISLGRAFSSSTSFFLKLEIAGKMCLYYYEYREYKQTGFGGTTSGAPTSTGYFAYVDKFLLQKKDGPLKWPRELSFRKDLMEYFSDCPELATKIDKKEFKKDHLIEIVRFYNSYCK
jgi:hypothetical protein